MCFSENMTPLEISMDNLIRNSYLKGNLVCGFCFRSFCGCISQTCNNPLAQNSHKWTSSKAECTCDIKPSRMTTVHEQLCYCWKCALRQQICCRFENNLTKREATWIKMKDGVVMALFLTPGLFTPRSLRLFWKFESGWRSFLSVAFCALVGIY